jgi:hypothetical protein
VLGGRSFTIGPFYAKPKLLIGFAAETTNVRRRHDASQPTNSRG